MAHPTQTIIILEKLYEYGDDHKNFMSKSRKVLL